MLEINFKNFLQENKSLLEVSVIRTKNEKLKQLTENGKIYKRKRILKNDVRET